MTFMSARADTAYCALQMPNGEHPRSRVGALASRAMQDRIEHWLTHSYVPRTHGAQVFKLILLTFSPSNDAGPPTTIDPPFVRAHPVVCLAVHTLLTSQDLVHIIQDLQDPTDDHVDLEFGRWLQSELREEWCPSIECLVRRLGTLTIAFIIGMLESCKCRRA